MLVAFRRKSTRTGRCKGACLSGGTSNRSALAGGATFLQVKCMVRPRKLQFTAFLGPDSLPQFLALELCCKECDKQNVEFRCSLAFFCDLTQSWARMGGGKNGAKNYWFLNWGARAEKMWKIASKNRVSLHFVFSTQCKYQCFWLVCFDFKPLVKKTSQKTVFSVHSQKKQCK